ncbi:MAG: DNA repair protein RadA [Pseudomonadota bacterium]
MARSKTLYQCANCGATTPKWQGQCPDCGAWNTLAERPAAAGYAGADALAALVSLDQCPPEQSPRVPSGFAEFDRVLGGGLVPGSVVLLGGDPGVGKSTLLLQVGAALPTDARPIYVSGEESAQQVAARAHRLGIGERPLPLLTDTSVSSILAAATRARATVIVVDSIQTMVVDEVSSAAGSVTQLREAVGAFVRFAKQHDVCVLLVGHVTKEGVIAGPRVVEHMVDTVLYFESDPSSRFRVVRAVKNRFGASNELGFFAMDAQGFREVRNPSAMFLSRQSAERPGSIVLVSWEGSRPLLVELQSLVTDAVAGQPRRLVNGLDQNRLPLLLAVLQRHAGLSLAGQDVFVNVVGGLRIAEPAADLATLLAIVSSFRDRSLPAELVAFGEVGLAGEVRPVRFGEERLLEAAKQGFGKAIVPAGNKPRRAVDGLTVHAVETLEQAVDAVTAA